MNDKYQIIGGVLYNTPVDDTHADICSEYFHQAVVIADGVLAATQYLDLFKLLINVDRNVINYMNSRLVDFIVKNVRHLTNIYYIAVKYGRLDVLKYLVDRNISKNMKWNYNLLASVRYGHLDIVRYLVEEHKTDPTFFDSYSMKIAISHNRRDIVKYLYEHGAIAPIDYIGIAARAGNVKMLKTLSSIGVNIPQTNDLILLNAIRHNRINVLRYLFANGFNFTVDLLRRSLWVAPIGNIKYIINRFVITQAERTFVANLIARNTLDYTAELLSYIVELDANIIDLPLILVRSILTNKVDTVKCALDLGFTFADVDIISLYMRKPEIITLLERHDHRVFEDNTIALQYAMIYGRYDQTVALLSQGVSINERVLHECARLGRFATVRYILDNKLNVSDNNYQVISSAAQYGQLEIVQYMAENYKKHGTKYGYSYAGLIEEAGNHGHTNVVKYLMNMHIKSLIREVKHVRSTPGHKNVIKYLESRIDE